MTTTIANLAPATDKQVAFLTKLSVERGVATAEDIAKLVEQGLLKRTASQMIDGLLKSRPAPVAPPKPTAPEFPAGRYALVHDSGTTYFFQVDRPTEGKWAGYTFVKRVSGDNLLRVDRAEAPHILRAIAADPLTAARRYGREKRCCGMCGHGLTDDTSLKLGIGPDCIKNHFGVTQKQAIVSGAFAKLRPFKDELNNEYWDAQIQRREREEDERVAAYKAERDGF